MIVMMITMMTIMMIRTKKRLDMMKMNSLKGRRPSDEEEGHCDSGPYCCGQE